MLVAANGSQEPLHVTCEATQCIMCRMRSSNRPRDAREPMISQDNHRIPQHVMQIQIKFAICAISYLTGGKPSSENGSHAHGCIIQSKDVVCRNLCSWSFSFCLWIGKQYFTSRYRVSERLTATSTKQGLAERGDGAKRADAKARRILLSCMQTYVA